MPFHRCTANLQGGGGGVGGGGEPAVPTQTLPVNKAVPRGTDGAHPLLYSDKFIPRPRRRRGPVRIVQTFLPLVEGGGWRLACRRRPSLTSLHVRNVIFVEIKMLKTYMIYYSLILVAYLGSSKSWWKVLNGYRAEHCATTKEGWVKD